MRVELADDPDVSKTELVFECGPYDGIPPVRSFFAAHSARNLHPDRLAIAIVLLLKPYICGPLTLPKSCSPEIAVGLEHFLAPLDVKIMSVNYAPFEKPVGAKTARLLLPDFSEDDGALASVNGDAINFGLTNTDEFQSSLMEDEVRVCCNLRALPPDRSTSMALALLGLCVLCAEDADIHQIICPPQLVERTENFDLLARTAAFSNLFIGA